MAEFKEICKSRHSVRKFKEENIDDKLIDEILEIVQTSPSAGNLQTYEVIVVKDGNIRKELAAAALGQRFIAQAPVVLVFMALPFESFQRYRERGLNLYAIQDATIACTYAMLAAQSLGLSSVWVGAFENEKVSKVLMTDEDRLPMAILPIGYSIQKPEITLRKPLDDIVRRI